MKTEKKKLVASKKAGKRQAGIDSNYYYSADDVTRLLHSAFH